MSGMSKRIGVYPGSFDPVTRGHEDVVRRSLAVVDELVVAVAVNLSKTPLFTLEERIDLLRRIVGGNPRIHVEYFDGLLVDFVEARGATVIVRGLRAVSDFDFEFQMALMNRGLAPEVETVFFMSAAEYNYLSSSLIREVATFGGDVSALVHPIVQQALIDKIQA